MFRLTCTETRSNSKCEHMNTWDIVLCYINCAIPDVHFKVD